MSELVQKHRGSFVRACPTNFAKEGRKEEMETFFELVIVPALAPWLVYVLISQFEIRLNGRGKRTDAIAGNSPV